MNVDDDSHLRALFDDRVEYRSSIRGDQIRQIGASRPIYRSILWTAVAVVATGTMAVGAWRAWPDDSTDPPAATDSPLLTHSQMPVGMTAELSPSMRLDLQEGCLVAKSHVVVWPGRARWDANNMTVSFEQDGAREITVGSTFPAGLGGGLVPLDLMARYLSPEGVAQAERCMDTRSDDLLVVN